jgi:hypothetical protein
MAFIMKIENTKLEGMDVIPAGIYEVKLDKFGPKNSKSGTSVNLNPQMSVVNHPDFAGRKVFDSLNQGGAFMYPDFVHAFGLPMETDGKDSWIPGTWDADKAKFKEDDASTWVYQGPIVGRIAKVEIAVENFNGKDTNRVRRYICAVADCASKFPKVRHSADLLKRSK